MYRRLVEMHRSGGLSFANATFFNLDEYLGLAPDHRASYHVYMKEHFYGLIDADPARVFVPDGTAPDPEAECERYEAAIREAGGIDVCVLGIGRNGHIGFNEPGAPFDSRTRVVELSESTRKVNASRLPSRPRSGAGDHSRHGYHLRLEVGPAPRLGYEQGRGRCRRRRRRCFREPAGLDAEEPPERQSVSRRSAASDLGHGVAG